MSQKMYRTIKRYPNITQLMYQLLGASDAWDGELKIEAIAEHPDEAKNALIKICAFLYNQGGQDYMEANLLQVFHFTDIEVQLANLIYIDYKDQQAAYLKRVRLQYDHELIKRWETYGKTEHDFDSDMQVLTRPHVDIEIDSAIAYIDSITANPINSSMEPIASIVFTISEHGKVENFKVSGKYDKVFSANNFMPTEPMYRRFEHLDTTICVPCKVKFSVTEEWENIKKVEIEINYNKKKDIWNVLSYDPNKVLELDDLQIIHRFLKSLPMDIPLREKKHSLCVNICKHWIKFNNDKLFLTFPLTRQCRIEKVIDNKSSIQKYGEKHWNW